MGTGEIPNCNSLYLNEDEFTQNSIEQFRPLRIIEARNNVFATNEPEVDTEQIENGWQITPSYSEYNFSGDLVPANPQYGKLNRTNSGPTP